MKKYKKLMLFVCTLFALVFSIQYSLDLLYKKRVHQKFAQIFNHAIDKNLMIFGSSVAYHHFDPNVITGLTHLSAYNVGWDGIFFVQYDCLIREYLKYEKNCQYIIIACDFDNLGKNELITRPDLFYAYLSNEDVYYSLHEIEPQKILLARYIPGYKLTLLNKNFYKDILFNSNENKDTDGFNPFYIDSFDNKKGSVFNARYDDKIFSQLKNTIDSISQKGIKIIFVMTPVFKDGYKLILNANTIKNKYRSLTNKNVYFLDYTLDSMNQEKAFFTNYSHLNSKGAELFSKKFSNDLSGILGEPK